MDFSETSDGRLATVHDWAKFGDKDGTPLSSEEWKKEKLPNGVKPVFLEDVLDQMVVNKDMYLILDTKSVVEEEVLRQFQLIVSEGEKRGVLARVILQIYNQKMYNVIKRVYDFKSIIYTLYQSTDSEAEVVEFMKQHDDIDVVTMSVFSDKFNKSFIDSIHNINKRVYVHPVTDYSRMVSVLQAGVDGMCVDFLKPADFESVE